MLFGRIRAKLSQINNGYFDCKGRKLHSREDFHKLAEAQALRRFLKQLDIDCVIDVGANRGQYATALRSNAGFNGHIISIEPVPAAFAELHRQTEVDTKWHALNVALSTDTGTQKFNVMRGEQFSSFLAPATDEFSKLSQPNTVSDVISVEAMTLDDLMTEWQKKLGFKRPFLKLDTQGFDHVVLDSGKQSLALIVGVQSEVAFKRLYQNALSFYETMELLDTLGFSLSAIFPNNAGHFPDCIEQDAIFYNRKFFE